MNIIETDLQFSGLRPRTSTSLIVLHHSASPDVPAAEIHAWHLAKGWAGIGYHFVIRKDGSIERGRPLEAIGAHAGPDVNGHSIGICLCGDFMQQPPAATQMESLLQLITWLNQNYAADHPQGLAIKLHREVAATLCPGDLFPAVETLRLDPVAETREDEACGNNWENELMQEARRRDLIQEDHAPDEPAPKWFVLAVALRILESVKNGGNKMRDKQKKMTLQQFGPWLQEKAGAEYRGAKDRTDCVTSIDHIEPGCFAALYAVNSVDGLVVVELAENFSDPAAAWEALANDQETYPPVLFDDWVEQQYLTDREAKVERFEI